MADESDKLANQIKETRKKLSASEPRLFTPNSSSMRRQAISDVLPEGSSLAVPFGGGRRSANSFFGGSMPEGSSLSGGSGNSMYHAQRPIMPEFDSPDREQYPRDRQKANFYWRLFHKYDPIFGNAIDMFAEMIVSDFDIVVKGDDSQTIKQTLEYMCDEVNLIEVIKYIIKEYLVIGECIPQNFFSEEKGIWTYTGFHNPDFIEIKDTPIIKMDPIINFVPDESLRAMLTDGTPESMELRQKLPNQFVSKVISRQKIKLSPVNCSFIARKLHPYDIRGTSLASRLWRIWVVEDASYASTIATYRRAASPLKVVKLGDPASGWIPDPSQEAKLLQLLAQAEMDPQAFLVWNYGISYEAWGSSERAVNIKNDHDTIEKVKLSALGLSKSFMSGEVSFASAKSGLQVFLRRLLSLRQYLDSTWISPKFFRPISEMNDWKRAKPSEVAHNYRIKRTAQQDLVEDETRIIMPELIWKNKLDPKLDEAMLSALKQLEGFGFKVSKGTIGGAVSLDWKEELEAHLKEFKEEKDIKDGLLGKTLTEEYDEKNQPAGAKPPGGPGAGAKPPGADKKPGGKPSDPAAIGSNAPNTTLDDSIEGPGEGGPPVEIE